MKGVVFPGLGLALLSVSTPALAADSGTPSIASPAASTMAAPAKRNWGSRHNGRWTHGWRAPGGWGAYRPVTRGGFLPGYWIAPRYYIGNYARYGWSAPPAGYGWSRYYDDAVLTDRDGRVYETHRNVDWDRYDEYRDGPDGAHDHDGPRNAKGELVGAAVGGAVGAIAGNVIAGRGDRLAGSVVGGVVGAAAGAAIGGASERRGERFLGERRGRHSGQWSGTWRGRHNGGPETVYEGSFDGEYHGSVPHWRHHGGYYGGGYHGGGYEEVVTTTVRPIITTTTTVTEQWVPAPARGRVAYKSYKPSKTKLLRR